jgi:5-methylcytosine-specific restriction endonuclease McrA
MDQQRRLHDILFDEQQGRCFYCARKMRPYARKKKEQQIRDFATKDHFIPRSRGGLHLFGNKVLACAECNGKKGNMSAFEFVVHMIGTSPL